MKRLYSTTDLARLWDVSESTIKRWADAGLLKCNKTMGGHRKFDLDEVCRFQNQNVLVAPQQRGLKENTGELDKFLAASDFSRLVCMYKEKALAGDERTIAALVTQAFMHGMSVPTICEKIIKPAMAEVGELWRVGKAEVYEEHLATFATLHALAELQALIPRKPGHGRLALVGCSEGEFHQVASVMVRHILEMEGWRVICLGTHTPLFSFGDAINRFKPELVCISTTILYNLERVARDYSALHRTASKQGARIIVGGIALENESVRARFRGALYVSTLYELVKLLREMG
ncbi:MAG TPA: B12-binding domain-containing protein [Blastocatellia bacterium]|nr:B12-binding domain-containing protein [Blastocatellia bacterium]